MFALEDVVEGSVYVTDRPCARCPRRRRSGAAAVVSSFQLPYAKDPTGRDRHFDAIFEGRVRPGSTLPAMYVSLRTAENIRQAAGSGAILDVRAEVRTAVRELRTVVATIVGAERPEEVVYVVAHVSGSGANDNAAGAAAVVELARTIKRSIAAGAIERPRRSIRFVFGNEAEAGGTALDNASDTPVAGIVADMIGASYARTGAICLLERGWDPGAVVPLAPDVHTPWGAGSVAEEDILPNGLAIVLRQALVDVGESVVASGEAPWVTREHPWEGGATTTTSSTAVAAARVWHLTDFSHSTSLDRMVHVDGEELRRTTCAIGAAALAIADMVPGDLRRHLDSLNLEARLRMDAARAEGVEGLAAAWKSWFDGARFWLRALAGEVPPDLDPLEPIGEGWSGAAGRELRGPGGDLPHVDHLPGDPLAALASSSSCAATCWWRRRAALGAGGLLRFDRVGGSGGEHDAIPQARRTDAHRLGHRLRRRFYGDLRGRRTARRHVGREDVEADPRITGRAGGLPDERGTSRWTRRSCTARPQLGAVGRIENILHPSEVARLVMERTDHRLIVGPGAYRLRATTGIRTRNS